MGDGLTNSNKISHFKIFLNVLSSDRRLVVAAASIMFRKYHEITDKSLAHD